MRIRIQAPIDRDAVSPDSILAANAYLTHSLLERAESMGVAMNWNTWRCYTRRKRNGDLIVTQWVKVAR